MKCYLINLDRSPDRFDWFTTNNAIPNLEIIRVPAVDGDCLDTADKNRLLQKKKSNYPMPAGAFGCFLSHRRAWKTIVDANHEWAFVAEDDAHIAKDALDLFNNTKWFPEDADIIKAETSREVTEVALRSGEAVGKFKLRRLKAAHRNTAAYFISRKAATRLLHVTEHYCDPIDEIMFNPELGVFERLNILQLDPAIAIQDKDAVNPFGMRTTIVRSGEAGPKQRMRFGPAKLKREISRGYRKSVRPRLLRIMRRSSFQRISYADD